MSELTKALIVIVVSILCAIVFEFLDNKMNDK